MININDLVKDGKFKDFIDSYNEKVEYNNLFDICLSNMLNNYKYDVLSLEKLSKIYNTCKEYIDEEEFKEIEFGLFRKFPNLESFVNVSEDYLDNHLETEEYLKNGIRFNYDNKYHIYVPCECGVKCLVTGDIIGGCESQEEIDFLINCFRKKGILLENYRINDNDTSDYFFTSGLLNQSGIFENKDYISYIYFDENDKLDEDLYFQKMSELVKDIDKKLMAKHSSEDLVSNNIKVNVKK